MGEPYIICEVGLESQGNPYKARELIRTAKDCGGDLIKFQAVHPECAKKPLDFKELALDGFAWNAILDECAKVDIEFFASVFCEHELRRMEALGCTKFKTAACDLIRGMKWKQETDMEWWASFDIRYSKWIDGYSLEALGNLPQEHKPEVLFLTVSNYPATYNEYMDSFDPAAYIPFDGLSDHTLDTDIAIMAAYHGVEYFEHHMALNPSEAIDRAVAFSPEQMRRYIEKIHEAFDDYSLTKKRLMGYVDRWRE